CRSGCLFLSSAPATPELSTLSLHDALPICQRRVEAHGRLLGRQVDRRRDHARHLLQLALHALDARGAEHALDIERQLEKVPGVRSEEHTSELQSRENLVCRLLLEKKKNTQK